MTNYELCDYKIYIFTVIYQDDDILMKIQKNGYCYSFLGEGGVSTMSTCQTLYLLHQNYY